jgi:predicted nucleic acid-binding protein
MVVIDATMLMLLLRPGVSAPAGPDGVPISHPKQRIENLVQELDKAKTKIVVPTPALSEALVRAGAAASQQIIEYLNKYAVFRIEPFDTRAAIEVAAMTRAALDSGKKKGSSAAVWAKIKYDRQIVAIAKVCGAATIYSDDSDIRAIAKIADISVIGLADLALPPEKAQHELPLEQSSTEMTAVEAMARAIRGLDDDRT